MRRVTLACLVILSASLAAYSQQAKKDGAPNDLNAYSLKFWPQNTLRIGEVVSTTTPYGVLTCKSVGRGAKRECTLK